MKNIIHEVLSKLNIQKALDSLADHLPAKLVGSVVISSLADIGQLLLIFCGLTFLDLFSRWLAISHDYCVKVYGKNIVKQVGGAWMYFKWILECRRFGYINSTVMKSQWCSKMLTYAILILACAWSDSAIKKVGGVTFISVIGISMVSLTEALSIVENLSSAEIGVADSIKKLLEKKKDSMK